MLDAYMEFNLPIKPHVIVIFIFLPEDWLTRSLAAILHHKILLFIFWYLFWLVFWCFVGGRGQLHFNLNVERWKIVTIFFSIECALLHLGLFLCLWLRKSLSSRWMIGLLVCGLKNNIWYQSCQSHVLGEGKEITVKSMVKASCKHCSYIKARSKVSSMKNPFLFHYPLIFILTKTSLRPKCSSLTYLAFCKLFCCINHPKEWLEL